MFGLQAFTPNWELQLLVSLVVAVVAFTISYLVHRGRHRFIERIHPVVVDLVSSVVLVAVVIGTTLVIADVWGQTDALLEQLGFLQFDARAPQVVITVVVLIAIQVFTGIATRLLDDLTTESSALTAHQREVSLRLTQLTLWVVGIIVILGVWDVDLTGLLVGAGFLGIVIGLAARKTLGSLLAGFVLMFSRPFEIGDWIVVDDREGIVSDITTMSTRIRSFDGEYVIVPNDVVSSEIVVNRTRRGRLRAEVDVGVDYDDDLEASRSVALATAEEFAAEDLRLLETPAPDVRVRRFGDSAIDLTVRVWIDRPTAGDVTQVRDELICRVKDAFDESGIKIPYPQRELSGREETGGFRLSDVGSTDEPSDTTDESSDTEVKSHTRDGHSE